MGYDDYITKHCVRMNGWLPASKELYSNKKNVKYFTLCAEEAIDIFMLEKEGVLKRDGKNFLPNVIICEKLDSATRKILDTVRPPVADAVIPGALEEILTFEENEHTNGKPLDFEDSTSRFVRNMFKVRRFKHRLLQEFPFDIINFDVLGNMLNPTKAKNRKVMKSLHKMIEYQVQAKSFLLFITVPLSDIDKGFHEKFEKNMSLNVRENENISNALEAMFGTTVYSEIRDDNKRIALGFAKSEIVTFAKQQGWATQHKGIFVYENDAGRKMMSSITYFSKASKKSIDKRYEEDIINIINNHPTFFAYELYKDNKEVKKHLEDIVEYRESFKSQFE